MEWRKTENSNNVKPSEVDTTSSKRYVYVRKDFELIPAKEEEGLIRPEHWEYMEKRIDKEDWELYEKTFEHSAELADIEDALIELAELITEVENG